MKFKHKIIYISILSTFALNGNDLSAQLRKDPRSVGMAGAYTTIARDFFAVGVNPANLGVVRNFIAMQIMQANVGFSNTSLSLFEYDKFNGADLERDNKKEELLSIIPSEGLTFFFDTSLQPVLGNLSWNNMAISTDIYSIGELTVPKAPFEILLNGNEIGREYELDAGGESLTAAEFGFSNGGTFGNFLVGYTARVIKGLNYFEIGESDAGIVTDSSGIFSKSEFFATASTGGWGGSLDIGMLILDVGKWHLGAAINNLYSTIRWNKNNERIRYFYNIDNLNLNRVAKKGYENLVVGGNERTKFSENFSVRLPTIFRIGASTTINKTLLVIDYQQGFSDRLYASKVGKFAVGIEYFGESNFPFRLGLAVGGRERKEFGLGFGMRFIGIRFDVAYALRGAFTPSNAKGFELSASLWTALGN